MSPPSTHTLTATRPPSPGKRPFPVWAIILALTTAILGAAYMLLVKAPPPRKIVIATGGKQGAYYQFAQKYAVELEKEGLTLEVRETKGSVENLQLLRDDSAEVAAAIVQSGVASPEDRDQLVALGSLYREPLWVFYRGETPLYMEQLPPKKIVIATGGEKGAYYQFAQQYAKELAKEGLTLEVRATEGSVENLQLLRDDNSGVSVAIVQSGLADAKDHDRLLALGSLYREPLWVFYRGEETLDRLSDLADKRIGVGKPGSGTEAVAVELLRANGLALRRRLDKDSAVDTAKKLRAGKLDAAFFVAAIEADYIKDLIKDTGVRLMSFSQHEAYHRKFRFLSQVTVPKGLVSLGQNVPNRDIDLLAPTAMLVVRKNTHPAVVNLLLNTAARVHAKGDVLSNPGEFPSAAYTDLPVSEEAKQFYKTGSTALPRLPAIDRLSYLDGKRLNVGPEGSGTYAVAVQMLDANNMKNKVTLSTDSVTDAAKKLQDGKLDAAFFVAAPEAGYIKDLMKDPFVRLLSFGQHEAYQRKYRYLSAVTIPAGLVDLGYNIPRQDIALVAPTAMLVVRKDLHQALIPVLLGAATQIHGKGDELANPGEFPSASYTDIPVSKDAEHYYKSGPPMLQRLLPFWLASLADRLKIMLIPLIMLLMPLIRATPPVLQWRTRRKIYTWYSALRDIDQKIAVGLSRAHLAAEIARLRDIENQVAFVEVPLSYMKEFYHLRLHLTMVQEKLEKLRAGG
jgi:TRAP transporter TAXI family solute receptor